MTRRLNARQAQEEAFLPRFQFLNPFQAGRRALADTLTECEVSDKHALRRTPPRTQILLNPE
jgi:hypothetical protein